MKSIDALREVSHELRLLAHYLSLVARDDDPGAEAARKAACQLAEIRLEIENRVAANEPVAPTVVQPARQIPSLVAANV